jgi:DNA topoisomerase-1
VAKKKGKGLQTLYSPSPELAAVIGDKLVKRTEVVKKLHAYIKKHGLSQGRTIYADDLLAEVLGHGPVDMFYDLQGIISEHLEKIG